MTISKQVPSQKGALSKPNIKCVFNKLALRLKQMKPNKTYRSDLDLKTFEQLESKKTLHSFKNLM